MTALARLLAALCLLLAPLAVAAHEVRPAFLHLTEVAPEEYEAVWKTPMRGDLRLSLWPEFSGPVAALGPVATRATGDAAVQTWRLGAEAPLRGQRLRISGLDRTLTDTLVRIDFADGAVWTARLAPAAPEVAIPARASPWDLAAVYTRLGVEHILLGVDHLLFVLGLLLIAGGGWRLVKTVSAFTLAHSLTLALAALGVVGVPVAPVEAAIALSILFLGPEIVRTWRGETSLTIRHPWAVSFLFGLLHGFGFATGLTLDGMPRDAVPQALLWFNVGVEAGQLAFVGLALAMIWAFGVLRVRWPEVVLRAPGYAVGALGAFWTLQRVVAMLAGRLA